MLQRWLSALLALAAAAVVFAPPVFAHGERAQEPYLRTRTAHWYDVKWSTDKVGVNEDITVTAKFRLFSDWPDAVNLPETVFVSNATPGPVFVRIESYLNGVPARQSFRNLQVGGDYEYKMVLRGRVPGRHHVHPMVAVKGSGPLVGPGKWIEITGAYADFKLPMQALSGEKIEDLQTWGVKNAVSWQLMWLLIAVAWLLWWLRRPLLIPRYLVLEKGREDLLTTSLDLKVAIGLLLLVIALAFGAYSWARAQWPKTVPLQTGTMKTPALPKAPPVVSVAFEKAVYDVPGRSLRVAVRLTNISDKPLRVGEFLTASIRFVNMALPAATANIDPHYPSELVARNGLKLDDDSPIAPGETKSIHFEATDVAWEIERLTSFLTDVDSRFGGLLFLYDDAGGRHMAEVGGPVLPVFREAKVAAVN
jgi:methane/ammonia monooxygenase subunit B